MCLARFNKCLFITKRNSYVLSKHMTINCSYVNNFLKKFFSTSFLLSNNKQIVKSVQNGDGKQNTFYFEPSTLLDNYAQTNRSDLFDKIPVVVLLGWAGSRDPQLKKYQTIYKDLGYHTIRFAPSDQLSFFQPTKQKPYAYELLELMRNHVKNNQIFLHIFSNACLFICYQHIITEIKGGKSQKYDFFRKNHKGLIVDSAFGLVTDPITFIGGVAGLLDNYIKFAPLKYLISTSLVVTWLLYDNLNRGDHYASKAMKIAINDERLVPTLNFYSTQDKLISSDKIAKHFQERKKLYPDLYLKTVVYNDAEHVLLYKKHPDDYTKHVYEHLKVCKLDLRSALDESDYTKLLVLNKNLKIKEL